MNNNDLLIYKKYTELYYYAYKLLEKYPKSERFGLVSDIKNSMNSTLKNILYAQKLEKEYKMKYLNMIDAELLYQRFSIRLSYNQRYISPNNYKNWSLKVAEIGKYNVFKVYELKERLIYSLPFYDRVVQQLYVYEYIMPYMLPKFISTSYACIPGKGLHSCIEDLQKSMRIAKRIWKEPYFVKYDISKFFYSINRKILFNIIKKYYKDKKFLKLTEKFINFTMDEQDNGKGIPIGKLYISIFCKYIYE